MKITAVNNFKINFPNRKTNPILSFKSDCKDELIISQKPTAEEISKEYFKAHKGKFTISDYKNLSEVEAKAIDYTIPKTTREAAELSYIAGTCLKDYFDEKFGEEAHPLYERLARYFQIMDSYHFISWVEDSKTK